MLERVVPTLDSLAYPFSPNAEWEALGKRDPAAGMRLYWLEILYRAHWAAATSLIRADRWLRGIQDGDRAGNLMVFAASLRGFLESSAETNDALNAVPFTLAEHYDYTGFPAPGPHRSIEEFCERVGASTYGCAQENSRWRCSNHHYPLEKFDQLPQEEAFRRAIDGAVVRARAEIEHGE